MASTQGRWPVDLNFRNSVPSHARMVVACAIGSGVPVLRLNSLSSQSGAKKQVAEGLNFQAMAVCKAKEPAREKFVRKGLVTNGPQR
jgi:hypothetical protein